MFARAGSTVKFFKPVLTLGGRVVNLADTERCEGAGAGAGEVERVRGTDLRRPAADPTPTGYGREAGTP